MRHRRCRQHHRHNRNQVRHLVPKGETLAVPFTLEGLWDTNDITVWIKAGNQDPYEGPDYTIPGPACFVIPEPTTIAALATSLLALAASATHRRKTE